RDLCRWLDRPEPRGLDQLIRQLVLAAFAEMTDRTWVRHGSIMLPQPELTAISDDMALRTPERPTQEEWDAARQRGSEIFGTIQLGPPRGRLIALFVQDVSARAREKRAPAHRLVAALERYADRLGLDPYATTGRLHTARAAAD